MQIKKIITSALEEDLGFGDITTDYLDLSEKNIIAHFVAKENGILCGLNIAFQVFTILEKHIRCVAYKKDGDLIKKGETFAKIEGYSSSILSGERVALNFLQRMSGIATMTNEYVNSIKPYQAKLLDTRKTTPLLRELEKYAVRIGGGYNHRFGLYDMVLIKDNHIAAVGSIKKAVELVKKKNTSYKIEVEVKNAKEIDEAVRCKVDRILLDNMSLELMKKAVDKYGKEVEFEASGGINIHNINQVASVGVHYISCGYLTHSYRSLDISLLIKEEQ